MSDFICLLSSIYMGITGLCALALATGKRPFPIWMPFVWPLGPLFLLADVGGRVIQRVKDWKRRRG